MEKTDNKVQINKIVSDKWKSMKKKTTGFMGKQLEGDMETSLRG